MQRVAVTGFGVVAPIGVGKAAFFGALAAGTSGIGPVTRFDASALKARLAAEVKTPLLLPEDVACYAAADPKVGFAFAACREALASAGIERLGPTALLHLGTSLEVFAIEQAVGAGTPDLPGVIARCAAGEGDPIKHPLDRAARLLCSAFGEPARALTNCSACAAGAQAIGHGFRGVRAGKYDLAVCGGFDSMLNPLGLGGFQLLGALSEDETRGAAACRPFDAARAGTVLGEGAAVLVMEPVEKARAAGKTILAEVCGCGSTLDAYSLSAPDPEGDGAARAMTAALADAGLAPREIAHINAHGTGTRLNDAIEAAAIRRVFDGFWERIPVSAPKSITGHMIAASGAAEAGSCLLTLLENLCPPNPSLEKVGKGCELDHVTGRARPFSGKYVLSNSFGFGGQNAVLVFGRAHD